MQIALPFNKAEIARLRALLAAIEQELTHTKHDDSCWANGRRDPHDPRSNDRHGASRDCVCGLDYLLALCRQRKPEEVIHQSTPTVH